MLHLRRCCVTEHEGIKTDKRVLRGLKDRILQDPMVKYYTTRVFEDRGDWAPFKSLIKSIENSDPLITGVFYEDSRHHPQGYSWRDGQMVGKYRDITVETEAGELHGMIGCYGAGSVSDPLSRYDMTLQLDY